MIPANLHFDFDQEMDTVKSYTRVNMLLLEMCDNIIITLVSIKMCHTKVILANHTIPPKILFHA